ncbi:hypothetical protein Trydic_g5524 [Trypoxylus dichotomus]
MSHLHRSLNGNENGNGDENEKKVKSWDTSLYHSQPVTRTGKLGKFQLFRSRDLLGTNSVTGKADCAQSVVCTWFVLQIVNIHNRQINTKTSTWADPLRVQIIKAHHNWIVVAYAHFVVCYRLKDSSGWQLVFTSPHIEFCIERIAINAKIGSGTAGETSKMVAIAYGSQVRLWGITEDGTKTNIGTFNLHVRVEYLFFIGSQLVALSPSGKLGVWHAMTQHWQTQDVMPIASFDTAGSFLLLGCNNGSIYYIDMQKFPLRMKDNDLLVTELYKDPNNDPVTAISVYLTPKTNEMSMRFKEIQKERRFVSEEANDETEVIEQPKAEETENRIENKEQRDGEQGISEREYTDLPAIEVTRSRRNAVRARNLLDFEIYEVYYLLSTTNKELKRPELTRKTTDMDSRWCN